MNNGSAVFNSFGDSSTVFSFFPSESHKKAVHRITVGLESKCGLVMLTGEIGTGKTTLFRHIQRQHSETFIFGEVGNPFLSPIEQISHFCKTFGLKSPQNLRQGIATLTSFFEEKHKEGKQVVLIFDESHLLTKSHWGQILVFSDLREKDEPIVQILLVGQNELVGRLMEAGLEALNQRIGIRCELSPLSLEDTRKYISFKLDASCENDIDFTIKALNEVWKLSGGVPRLINHACSHLLDQTVFSGSKKITPAMVRQLATDGMYASLFNSRERKAETRVLPLIGCLCLVVAAVFVFVFRDSEYLQKYFENTEVSQTLNSSKVRVAVSPAPAPPKDSSDTVRHKSVGSLDSANKNSTGGNSSSEVKAGETTLIIGDASKLAGLNSSIVYFEAESGQSDQNDILEENAAGSTDGEVNVSEGEDSDHLEESDSGTGFEIEDKVDGQPVAESDMDVDGDILDGMSVPEISSIKIGAVAYSEAPKARIAVLNQRVMHQGDKIGNIKLNLIGKDQLIFVLEGKSYRRNFGNEK